MLLKCTFTTTAMQVFLFFFLVDHFRVVRRSCGEKSMHQEKTNLVPSGTCQMKMLSKMRANIQLLCSIKHHKLMTVKALMMHAELQNLTT